MKICKKVQFEEKLFLELWSSPVGPSPDENDLLLWNYFFSGQTLDSDAPKKYMRENGNILVWCDLMPRVNLMYCITIKNGVVIYSWGSSIFLWLLWGNKSIFKPKKMTEGEWKTTYFLLHAELFSTTLLLLCYVVWLFYI